jgi:hypothetical protein
VAFVVSGAAIAARVAIPLGGKRAAAAAQRAAKILFTGADKPSGDVEGAALIATVRRQRPDLPFLRPAVNGGPREIAAAIQSFSLSFSENL